MPISSKPVMSLESTTVVLQEPYTLIDGSVLPIGTAAVITDMMPENDKLVKVTFKNVEGEYLVDTRQLLLSPDSLREMLRQMVFGDKTGKGGIIQEDYYILGSDNVPVQVHDKKIMQHWVLDHGILRDTEVGAKPEPVLRLRVDFCPIHKHLASNTEPPKLFEITNEVDGEPLQNYRRATFKEAIELHTQLVDIYKQMNLLLDSLPKE